MCGLGGELAQRINELAFDELDAPPGRLHTAPTSHPFAPVLERAMLVSADRVVQAVRDVIAGRPPVPDHWRSRTGPAASVTAPPPAARTPEPKPAAAVKEDGEGTPILMPFGDLTVSEGTLVGWRKVEGDAVAAGEAVAEIEPHKSVMEIEAPCAGTLARIDQPVGAVVAMGARIGSIRRANRSQEPASDTLSGAGPWHLSSRRSRSCVTRQGSCRPARLGESGGCGGIGRPSYRWTRGLNGALLIHITVDVNADQ